LLNKVSVLNKINKQTLKKNEPTSKTQLVTTLKSEKLQNKDLM